MKYTDIYIFECVFMSMWYVVCEVRVCGLVLDIFWVDSSSGC